MRKIIWYSKSGNQYLGIILFFSLQPVTDFLLKGLQFTHTAAKYMMEGTPVGEAFK